jgi:hypothetical protein
MVLVRILKRKDASSVLLAVLIALIAWQPLMQVTARLAAKVSGLHTGQYIAYYSPNTGRRGEYIFPIVSVILQLLALEILGWLYIWAKMAAKKR